jgi:hypothetical protein
MRVPQSHIFMSSGIMGTDLTDNMRKQSLRFGTKILTETVDKARTTGRQSARFPEFGAVSLPLPTGGARCLADT